ncbi:MAG: HAD family hydrolase [Lentisphaeria bacterium]
MYQLVLFDFDGTLTAPGAIDFAAIRRDINCHPGMDILAFIDTLDAASRIAAEAIIDRHEQAAAARACPNDHAEEVLQQLAAHGVVAGIITRNNRRGLERSLENFPALSTDHFDVIITRDDALPPKPDPAAVFAAAERTGTDLQNVMMVGDYLFDIACGRAAGVTTVWLQSDHCTPDTDAPPDHTVLSLAELPSLVLDGP